MIKRFNEYFSDNNDFLDSISKFKISREDYNFIYDYNAGDKSPKGWLYLDKKEKDVIGEEMEMSLIGYPYYILSKKIDLVKMEDDYYYVSFLFNHNNFYYYRLDQLTELKQFMKRLNEYKKMIK